MVPPPGERALPSWSTLPEALSLFARGVTARTALRVALVVGTVLLLINQGQVVWSGAATAGTWVRIGLNYVVPFVVASWGFLAACRERAA